MEAHPATAASVPAPGGRSRVRLPGLGVGLGTGMVVLYLSIIVLLPLAAVTSEAFSGGWSTFWDQVTSPLAKKSLELTVICSLIVAILTLVALYGNDSPIGIHLFGTRAAVVVALMFVTLPFVVRAVQPLLLEMDRAMEAAAASLGASNFTIFRKIVLPNLLPGLAAGVALAFARALGEFGSVLLFAGGLPQTMVASVFIRQQIESGNDTGAAAVSVVLLLASLLCLTIVGLIQ